MRYVREKIDGVPEGFRFHDLRHYLASLLIAKCADIKTVQARMRHAIARTTLDTYAHLWPDADEVHPLGDRRSLSHLLRTGKGSPAGSLAHTSKYSANS